jgi:hypothetical protein
MNKMRLFALLVLIFNVAIALAQEPVAITGHILGCNGSAMRQAHVQLCRPNQMQVIATVEADADGVFRLETKERGLFVMRFSGVYHQSLKLPVLLNDSAPVAVDVQLKAVTYPATIDSIRIIGDFNGFMYASAEDLDRNDDSVFTITFSTTASELAYQILLPGDLPPMPGTKADQFVFDGTGNYRSVITNSDDKVRIDFDPRLLISSTSEPRVVWSDTGRAKLAEIYAGIESRRQEYREALKEHSLAGRSLAEFSHDWSGPLKKLTRRIDSEPDSLLRQLLLVGYLDLATCDAIEQLDTKVVHRALEEIPPSSPLWAMNPRLVPLAVRRSNDESYESYTQRVIEQNNDPIVQATLLYDGLVAASRQNESELARQYYERLVGEFSSTPYAGMARVEYTMR